MNRQRFDALKDLKKRLEELQKRLETLKEEEEDEFITLIDKSDYNDFAVLCLEPAECRVEALEMAIDFLGEALGCLENAL